MSRAQLKHLLLDVTFKDKPKIIDLEVEFKPIARLLLMDILAACSAASNAEITINVCKHLGNRIGIDAETVERILDYCINHDILFSINGKITNARVIEDQESYARKLGASNARVTRYREKKETLQSKRVTRTPDIDIDNDIKLEIALPEFNNPKISRAIHRWAAHRKALKKPFDQMALDSLINLYRGRENELPDDIDHSISNGWKTLNAKSRDSKLVFQKPQQEVARPVIDNYKPPTAEEKRKPTEEEKKRVRELIDKSLGGRKVA